VPNLIDLFEKITAASRIPNITIINRPVQDRRHRRRAGDGRAWVGGSADMFGDLKEIINQRLKGRKSQADNEFAEGLSNS